MNEPPPYSGDLVEHLRSFGALAERVRAEPRGAFEETALGLDIDPSVLRRRIQTLSAYYDAPLLTGRGGALRVSPAGLAVVDGAERVLNALVQLRVDTGAAPRRLTVACTGTITTELLPHVIRDLERVHPELSVRIRRAGAAAARDLLENGHADLAVVRAASAPTGLVAHELCRDKLWIAVHSNHPLAERRTLRMSDVAKHAIVGYRARSSTRQRVMAVLGPLGADVRFEVDGRAAALRFVALGLGLAFVSLLPGHAIAAPNVVLRDVSRHFEPSYFWLCTKVGRAADALEAEAVQAIRKHARARRRVK